MSERSRNLFILLARPRPDRRLGRRPGDQGDQARPRPPGRRVARLPGQADQAAADDHPGRAGPRRRHHPRPRRLPRRRRAADRPLRARPDRRRPAGGQGRRAGRRARSAPRPRCTSTTGNRTSSTRTATPTRTRSTAARRRSRASTTPSLPGVEVRAVQRRQHHQLQLGTLVRLRQGQQAGQQRPAVADGRGLWEESPGGTKPDGYKSSRSRTGSWSSAGERPDPVGGKEAPKPDAWWVVRDDPALGGTDIKNPEQNFDQQGGGPIVTMEFTDKGKKRSTTRARSPSAGRQRARRDGPDPTLAPLRDRPRRRAGLTPYINWRENTRCRTSGSSRGPRCPSSRRAPPGGGPGDGACGS